MVQCITTLAFFPPVIVGMEISDLALILGVPILWLTIVAAVRRLIGVVTARVVSILIATGIACVNIIMVVQVQIGQSPAPPVVADRDIIRRSGCHAWCDCSRHRGRVTSGPPFRRED